MNDRQTSAQVTATEVFQALAADLREVASLASERFTTRRIAEGETMIRSGDEFHSLYLVRSGFFKTVLFDEAGTEKVLRFAMKNDLLGADGLADGSYRCDAIALEASEVIIVPFSRLAELARNNPALEHCLYSRLSRELVSDQNLLYATATLNAEGRVAAFLIDLAQRYGALGYSRQAFVLRMTRQEIGSYLGLKLETVSRAFSAFDAAKLIRVDLKRIEILDREGLRKAMYEPVMRSSGQLGSRETRSARLAARNTAHSVGSTQLALA